MQVHFNGFISVDGPSKTNLARVENQIRASLQSESNFMAVYWQKYVEGKLAKKSITRLIFKIKKG